MDPWVYSIAPFLYARAFEQIRIDVALHDLPVRIVGNGGGYHYGVMGSTHHAIEDYGALLTLQNMRVYVPAFSEDVPVHIDRINADKHPLYFRLGRSEKPADFVLPEYAPWRRLVSGSGPTLLAVGPLVGGILKLVANIDEAKRPTVWVVSELPCLPTMPAAFLADVARSESLFVVEEHVKTGSVGQEVAAALLECGGAPSKFRHFCAKGYPTGRYGSQEYHREESGINAAAVVDEAVNG
jgi:transketolase